MRRQQSLAVSWNCTARSPFRIWKAGQNISVRRKSFRTNINLSFLIRLHSSSTSAFTDSFPTFGPTASSTMASQTPTGASKRLLTMKFMQRGAAASASSTHSPSKPASDDGRPSKRPKTDGRSSPGGSDMPRYAVNQAAAQAALDEEERKRQAIVEKRAEQLGDSHWVLDAAKLPRVGQKGTPLRIVQVGFSQIDGGQGHDEEEQDDAPKADGTALQSYGPAKKVEKNKACDSPSTRSNTYADT